MPKKIHLNLALGIVSGIERILKEKQALRPCLNQLLKQNRKWGSRDRRLVGEGLLEIVRWQRRYAEMGQLNPKAKDYYWSLLAVWLQTKEMELPKTDSITDINKPISNTTLDPKTTPRAIFQSIPDWIDDLGVKAFGEQFWQKEIQSQNNPAPLTLRANSIKTNTEKLQNLLKKKYHINSSLVPDVPAALVLEKHQKLTHLDFYEKGFFEIQDLNSQKVADFCLPKPGIFVVDACAGAGGKTLHLAALMQNRGRILALDPYQKKLEQLEIRLKRNGVRIAEIVKEHPPVVLSKHKSQADIVLIDAPCSSLGVLRRNPATKWHLSPSRLEELKTIQQEIIQQYAPLVSNGGTLIYATCSLLPCENHEQIERFLKSDIGKTFHLEDEKSLFTHKSGGDGFYMARLIKV